MKIVNLPDELTARYAEKLIGNIDAAKKAEPLLKLIEKTEKTVGSIKWSALMTDAYKRGGKHDPDFVRNYDDAMEIVNKSVAMLDMVTDYSRTVVKAIKADKEAAKKLKKELAYLDGLPKTSFSVHKTFKDAEKDDRKIFDEFQKKSRGKDSNPFHNLHVDDVFRDKKLLTGFHKYAKKEMSEENVEFYWEALKAKSKGSVQGLYDKYIDEKSPKFVNVSSNNRKLLTAGLANDNWDDAWNKVKVEVKGNMTDTLSRLSKLKGDDLTPYL